MPPKNPHMDVEGDILLSRTFCIFFPSTCLSSFEISPQRQTCRKKNVGKISKGQIYLFRYILARHIWCISSKEKNMEKEIPV